MKYSVFLMMATAIQVVAWRKKATLAIRGCGKHIFRAVFQANWDSVLAERLAFFKLCKPRVGESIDAFEERWTCYGHRCEYNKMSNAEDKLFRDRFITGIKNDQVCVYTTERNSRPVRWSAEESESLRSVNSIEHSSFRVTANNQESSSYQAAWEHAHRKGHSSNTQ